MKEQDLLPRHGDTEWKRSKDSTLHPRSKYVKAVDKGLTARIVVKAVDKGVSVSSAREWRCSGGEKEGRNRDTVTRTLGETLPHPLLFVK